MSGVKITELPFKSSLSANDLFPIATSTGETRKILGSTLASKAQLEQKTEELQQTINNKKRWADFKS